jgi:hypothetical protein
VSTMATTCLATHTACTSSPTASQRTRAVAAVSSNTVYCSRFQDPARSGHRTTEPRLTVLFVWRGKVRHSWWSDIHSTVNKKLHRINIHTKASPQLLFAFEIRNCSLTCDNNWCAVAKSQRSDREKFEVMCDVTE